MSAARCLTGATQRPDARRVEIAIDESLVRVFREYAVGTAPEAPTRMRDGPYRVAGTAPVTLELERFILGYGQLVVK